VVVINQWKQVLEAVNAQKWALLLVNAQKQLKMSGKGSKLLIGLENMCGGLKMHARACRCM
jgi:hypothetical protein